MSDKVKIFKERVLKLQQKSDIAGLYVLELEAHDTLNKEDLNGYYANILELALENLTDALEIARRFKLDEVQDFATIRALYEYAIEHYSAGSTDDGAALFEILVGLSEDENFSQAMKIHQLSAQSGLDFDDFLNKIADIPATQIAGTFYISSFSDEAKNILDIAQASEGIK